MIIMQGDLFAPAVRGVPYQRTSATSKAAAERMRPHASNHEQLVYDAIVAAGVRGITRKELAAQLAFAAGQQNRVTGRVYALIEKGVVRQTSERRDGSLVLVASGARP